MTKPIREILIIPHTHHDVGYTHVPAVCSFMHERSIAEILTLCQQGADDAPDSLRWTMEISRPVIRFLKQASPQQVEQFQHLVARRRIALTGAYMHMTQLTGHEEYIRFFEPVRQLREHYKLPVSIVQHGDINGLSWGTVPLMAELGLDTLVMALNPDHGRAPFEQPSAFFWEGQDGSRVLVWLSMFYSLAHNRWGLTLGKIDSAIEDLQQLAAHLESRPDYPFDFMLIHSADDNMLPNAKICDAVRQWNERGLQPPMRITTIEDAMQLAQAQAVALPIVRGEWADWWAHGHGSTAYEVGLSRLARAELRSAEIFRSLHRLTGASQANVEFYDLPIVNWHRVTNFPLSHDPFSTRVEKTYENLLLFAEHTWGTFESATHPDSTFTRAHWNQKAEFVYQAVSEAHNLAREALTDIAVSLPQSEDRTIIAVNPTSTPRDELLIVRTPGVNHHVFVRDIPPLGAKAVLWEPEKFDAETPLPADTVIENDFYRLEVNPHTGSLVSLYDKTLNKEWVETGSRGLGAVLYESPDPADSHPAVTKGLQHFHPDTPGPRFEYATAHGKQPLQIWRTHYGLRVVTSTGGLYMPLILTQFILYDSMKAIDITITLNKHENYGMEGVYVHFPFALSNAKFWLETANAVYQADNEQLPDSCRDWYSIQHGIGITDGENSLLWATREAPLVQLGRIRTGEWVRESGQMNGHLYSWLMNNLYFTNFKAAQGGVMQFSYRITTQSGSVDTAQVRTWGEHFANVPLARVAKVQAGEYQWFDVEPRTVEVQIVRPLYDDNRDGFTIRLKECAGQPTQAVLIWKNATPVKFYHTDLLESTRGEEIHQQDSRLTINLAPQQLLTIEGEL